MVALRICVLVCVSTEQFPNKGAFIKTVSVTPSNMQSMFFIVHRMLCLSSCLSCPTLEIQIDEYGLFRGDKNRSGSKLLAFLEMILVIILNRISLMDIENIFFEILLPNSKPITIGIIAHLTK